MAKPIPVNFYIPQRPEQGESEQAFFNRVRAGSRAGVSALTGGVSHGVEDLQNFFEQYGSDDATLRRLMAQTPPSGESATSGGNMQLAQLLTFGAPGTGGNAFLTDYGQPGGGAPETPQGQQYGGILTLPNGQRIHPDDPNYATYAAQLGVQKIVPPTPSETPGIISSTSDPFKTAISDSLKANQSSIDAVTALPTTLPPSTASPATQNLPQILQTPAPGLTGDIFTEEGKQARSALETRRTQIESESLEEQESIKSEFAQERLKTERKLTASMEYSKALLAGRFGLTPQNSSQVIQFFQDVSQNNQQILNSILVAERRALLDAQKYYNQADFALVDRQLALSTSMRDRADKLQQFQIETDLKKFQLQTDMQEFAITTGLKSDELKLDELKFSLEKARTLANIGLSQAEIGIKINQDLEDRRKAEFEEAQDRFNMALNLPEGQEFTLSDGTVIKGLQPIEESIPSRMTDGGIRVGGIIGGISQEAQAVLNGTLRLEDLTPTIRGKIAGELSAAGYRSSPKLSSGQQDDVASMDTVTNLIDRLTEFNEDGKLEGIGSFGAGTLKSLVAQAGFGSEEGKSVRALIGNIKGTIAKLRGGTSFTPNEEKLLNTYTPDINDAPSVAINKLTLLKDFINLKKVNLFKIATERGVSSQSVKIDNLRDKYNYSTR